MFGSNGFGLKFTEQQFMGMEIRDETKKKVLRDNAMGFLRL
jgi:hypothetical protein